MTAFGPLDKVMGLLLEFLFEVVFGAVFCWTGEIVLFVVTMGKHKPRWDLYTEESPCRFAIFSEISLWVGVIFWVVVLVVIAKGLLVN